MSELPMPYSEDADVPLTPLPETSDERLNLIASTGASFQQLIRDSLSGPYVEQATRYVDLAVQAAYEAAHGGVPEGQERPGEPAPGT